MGDNYTASYVRFAEVQMRPGIKTRGWLVMSTRGHRLGLVKWYARWRGYAFWPEPSTTFNDGCLTDIATFCTDRTREHRLKETR